MVMCSIELNGIENGSYTYSSNNCNNQTITATSESSFIKVVPILTFQRAHEMNQLQEEKDYIWTTPLRKLVSEILKK